MFYVDACLRMCILFGVQVPVHGSAHVTIYLYSVEMFNKLLIAICLSVGRTTVLHDLESGNHPWQRTLMNLSHVRDLF